MKFISCSLQYASSNTLNCSNLDNSTERRCGMGKYLIMIGCAILVIIGLLIRQWFISLSPKKTGEAEEETQVYSDLTKTGVRIKLKWIQTIYLCYAILHMHYSVVSWNAVAPYMTMEAYRIMSIIAAVYTVVIIAYNFKFETRQTAKSACYTGTLVMLFGLLVVCVKNM